MITRFFKWIGHHFGWIVPERELTEREKDAYRSSFQNDPFFTAHRAKTLRLAEIARERTKLKERLQVAIKQKKARSPIYQALKALSSEELRLESGR